MSAQEKETKNLEPTDTFDENPGIIQKFKATYSATDVSKEECEHKTQEDPVHEHDFETKHPKKEKQDPLWDRKPTKEKSKGLPIDPSIGTRMQLDPYVRGTVGAKFEMPETHAFKWFKHEKRLEFYNATEFCDYEVIRLPSPIIMDNINDKIIAESPNVSHAKVLPEKPSAFTSSMMVPPTVSYLKAHKIRSGINFKSEDIQEESSESTITPKKPRCKKYVKLKKRRKGVPPPEEPKTQNEDFHKNFQDLMGSYYDDYEAMEYEEEGDSLFKPEMFTRSTHVSDNLILGKYGEILSYASSATSMQDRDITGYTDVSWCEIPLTSRLVQTLRDGQCEKPKKKYKKGALENHSLTKLRQNILTDFAHHTVSGSIHQCDICFPKISQGNQGMCMPIAAFCFGHIKRPREWTSKDIDEIVEMGNCHFLASIAELHLHKGRKVLTVDEINNLIFLCGKKIKFEISPPAVKGLIRSMDHRIYNLSTALRLFFLKYQAGILRTECQNYLIWKLQKSCFLFFDATPRKSNIFQDKSGTATMTLVHSLKAIRSILLDRSNIGNNPFNISQIKVLRVMCLDENEADDYIKERNTYIALNERQAVLQGSYDLGDLCFLFNRNKQALSMSVLALAYSRISVPHCWHKKTLDKILIIGNQLHSLIVEAENCPNKDVGVDHLPALFTVGPYVIEIHVYANLYADLMYKKGNCMLLECLSKFFENNNNALCQIGKSFLAIWQQRDMFFCFDPYTRNKEGLKCRQGTAAVTMNKDVETLVNTVVMNFENREAIFHLHAIKLIRIQRDPQLTKIFPRHLTLQEIPMETFYKHRCKKSKKRATEKPFATADFKEKALKTLLAGVSPGASLYDIQSNIQSLGANMVPALECPKLMKTPKSKKRQPEDDEIVDLDSPSLSDTQIVPKRPNPYEDQINIDDLAAFGLTQEEKELEEAPEGGEGDQIKLGVMAEGLDEDEGDSESNYGGVFSQVNSGELDPCFTTHQINTDLTFCYKILPALELPIRNKDDRDLVVDQQNQIVEFAKLRHFETVNPDMQILSSIFNAFDCCDNEEPNLVIPYMCIMAAAYDLEKPINKWDKKIVSFVMKAGLVLYRQYNESFLHIDDYKFELKKNNIFCTVDVIFHTYIGDGIFDTFSGQRVLEQFIDKHVFNDQNVGFVIVPHYSCAVFFKRDVFYLFDPYNCDKNGVVQNNDQAQGKGCVMRFRSLDDLIKRLVDNLSRRVEENDTSGLQFRMLILAKPNFELSTKKDPDAESKGDAKSPQELALEHTVSNEFARPSNYIQLPDGSQLVRGRKHVGDLGAELEYVAPYICVMATAVAEKYAVRTWSTDVLEFVLQAGDVLYKKSKYRFAQLTKLEIPTVSLGSSDYKIQVSHLFEAPFTVKMLRGTIGKVTESERDWVFIVTEVYTCCAIKRNGIYYLYDPFACNELGLHDSQAGTACIARFRNLEDLVNRILFNKTKEELPERVVYTRFSVSVCRASRLSKRMLKRLEEARQMKAIEEARRIEDGAEGVSEEEEEEEPQEETKDGQGIHHEVPDSKNVHGYQKVNKVEVLEGSRALPRPASGQVTLLEDYFACLCACLMVIHKPLDIWDTKTVDRTLDLGTHVFNHADNLEHARRRTIRNVLVGKYFFDVIVKLIEIEDYKYRKSFSVALDYVMRKRRFVVLCTGEGTYVIYLDTENNLVHIFHPYAASFKGRTKDEPNADISNSCWIKFRNVLQMKRFLKQGNNLNRFKFYTFSVINVTKAPRSAIVSNMIQEWIRMKQLKGEAYGKSFHEHESWMDLHNNPWARLGNEAAQCGTNSMGTADNKWYAWDIEYVNDLYSLAGTINERSRTFKGADLRGKQTLADLVIVIGMTGIYDLIEWNSSVIDAVLVCGYKYMKKCLEALKNEDSKEETLKTDDFDMEDLLEVCEIFPYTFKVRSQPVIDGTMFINSFKRYNLYRALRHFFDEYYYRAGIIIADKGGAKKMVAFAKRKDNEYYMFDSSTYGSPMFAPNEGVAYMLRCTTLARLVHVLTLTLRGGDFYVYEVIADQFKAIEGDVNPYEDEKPKLKP